VYDPFLSTTRSTPVKCIRVVVGFVSVATLAGEVDGKELFRPAPVSEAIGACTNKRAFEQPIVMVYIIRICL